jgi:hypothetical protein
MPNQFVWRANCIRSQSGPDQNKLRAKAAKIVSDADYSAASPDSGQISPFGRNDNFPPAQRPLRALRDTEPPHQGSVADQTLQHRL